MQEGARRERGREGGMGEEPAAAHPPRPPRCSSAVAAAAAPPPPPPPHFRFESPPALQRQHPPLSADPSAFKDYSMAGIAIPQASEISLSHGNIGSPWTTIKPRCLEIQSRPQRTIHHSPAFTAAARDAGARPAAEPSSRSSSQPPLLKQRRGEASD